MHHNMHGVALHQMHDVAAIFVQESNSDTVRVTFVQGACHALWNMNCDLLTPEKSNSG